MASDNVKNVILQTIAEGTNSTYTTALDYSGGADPIYVGEAAPGTTQAQAGWRIKKLTYSGSDVTDIKWAGGNSDFDNVWNDRASETYS